MSGYFYIEDQDGEVYELSVTESIQIGYTTNSSNYPIEDGFEISDGVTNGNATVSYSGLITGIKNFALYDVDNDYSVSENIQRLLKLRDSRKTFTIYYDSRETTDTLLPSLDNCVFTRLNFSRGSGDADSYKASIDIKQLIISEQAVLVKERIEQSAQSQSSATVEGSTNNTRYVEPKQDVLLEWSNTLLGGNN